MSAGFVGLLLGAGVAAWVYNYFYRKTGGNSKTAIIMASVAGAFGFIVTFFAFRAFMN